MAPSCPHSYASVQSNSAVGHHVRRSTAEDCSAMSETSTGSIANRLSQSKGTLQMCQHGEYSNSRACHCRLIAGSLLHTCVYTAYASVLCSFCFRAQSPSRTRSYMLASPGDFGVPVPSQTTSLTSTLAVHPTHAGVLGGVGVDANRGSTASPIASSSPSSSAGQQMCHCPHARALSAL